MSDAPINIDDIRRRKEALESEGAAERIYGTPEANGSEPTTPDPEQPLKLPSPAEPMPVARKFVADHYKDARGPLLRHWRGQWWEWQKSHWAEVELRKVRAAAYDFTEDAQYEAWDERKKADVLKPWAPNRHKVANVLEALAGIVLLSQSMDQPSWIKGGHDGVIVACANGLLDVGTRTLREHTPSYFNQTAVPFDYDPDAPEPMRWLCFLDDLWGKDADQIAALQEWFGYTISGRLDLHKIMLLVGPTRAGKGVIARVLGALIGRANVAGPTLSSLNGEFGLAPLIGKPLAVIADARLSGRDSSTVVERLLSISGEDMLSVNIKYREQWNGKLPSRFLILSNELPRLGDASAAIAGRFVTLLLERSWLGKEDSTLEPELHRELTGILNWSLDGLSRLTEQGRFTRPGSTETAFTALQDLASPVGAFIRDCCAVDPDAEIPVDDLWGAWRRWAEDNGHGKGGTKQLFGRDLRAAIPQLRVRQIGAHEDRERVYAGIRLKNGALP
jgi:putative DNA primase/helicase